MVYKPHPRIAGSTDPGVVAAHTRLLRLSAATPREAGHLALGADTNLLATFSQVDALVTDVSAVGLDYLFLQPESPIFRNDPETPRRATQLAAGSDVVRADNVAELKTLISSRLATDSFAVGPTCHPEGLLRRPGAGR